MSRRRTIQGRSSSGHSPSRTPGVVLGRPRSLRVSVALWPVLKSALGPFLPRVPLRPEPPLEDRFLEGGRGLDPLEGPGHVVLPAQGDGDLAQEAVAEDCEADAVAGVVLLEAPLPIVGAHLRAVEGQELV